jgi:MFS superfamily sulfate permease-like transporter
VLGATRARIAGTFAWEFATLGLATALAALGVGTVAAYLVPQVMAYAEVAGLPAIAGLWAAVAPLIAYAILGSSRQLSVGPESSTALMTAATVSVLVAGDQQNYANTAAVLALAVGAICLICWVARLGFLANLLSHPVLIGYMAGIAGLMIVSQLGKVTGISVEGDSVLSELRFFVAHLGQLHWPTLLVAGGTLGLSPASAVVRRLLQLERDGFGRSRGRRAQWTKWGQDHRHCSARCHQPQFPTFPPST